MDIDPKLIEELKALPPEELERRVKQLEARAVAEGLEIGKNATAIAQGDVDRGVTSAGFKRQNAVPTGSPQAQLRAKLAEYERDPVKKFADFNVTELKPRTERERVDSLTKRLIEAVEKQPWEAEMILKGAALEEWKRGNPVSYDQLREAAQPLIEKAAANG